MCKLLEMTVQIEAVAVTFGDIQNARCTQKQELTCAVTTDRVVKPSQLCGL